MDKLRQKSILDRIEEIKYKRDEVMFNHNKLIAVSQKEYDISTNLLMKEQFFLESLLGEKNNQSDRV